jgi:Na+/H+ antiporter NhaC
MIGSGAGLIVAALFAVQAGQTLEIPHAAWSAVKSMMVAIFILYLAWMIGGVCASLGTASYLTVLLGDAISPLALPAILFVLSGVVAFSTGSSWSTMSILLPLVVWLSFNLGESVEIGGYALMIISIGAVLEGAIFGDHCSPISDTTIMSSISSASDHIDHVRTQAPYALVAMVVALVVGYFPCTFLGLNPFLAMALGVATLVAIVFIYGRKAVAESAAN